MEDQKIVRGCGRPENPKGYGWPENPKGYGGPENPKGVWYGRPENPKRVRKTRKSLVGMKDKHNYERPENPDGRPENSEVITHLQTPEKS